VKASYFTSILHASLLVRYTHTQVFTDSILFKEFTVKIASTVNILFKQDLRVKQENCLEEWTSVTESCASDTNMHHNSTCLISSRGDVDALCVENSRLNSGFNNAVCCTKNVPTQSSSSHKDYLRHSNSEYLSIEPSRLKTEVIGMMEPILDEKDSSYVSSDDRDISVFDGEASLKEESQDSTELKPLIYVDVKNNIAQPVMQISINVHKNICIKRLNTAAKYRCSFCKKPFVNKAHLTQHLMIHTGERPFVCDVCGVAFSRYSNLTRHSFSHTREKSRELKRGRHRNGVVAFECATCLKIFKRKPYLVEHLMSHTGEKPFKCEVCGVNFRRHSNLVRHIKSHSESDYLTGQHLQRGRRRSKDNRVKYNCDVCSKTFRVGSHLKTHMITHTGEKHFMCDVCGQFFARQTNMVRHAKLHTEGCYQSGEVPRRGRRKKNVCFECHVCSKPFHHMSRWREHLMSHTGEKPYMCDICGKFFARHTNLIRHSKVHIIALTS
jgi:uncharacterized Zn-finger protein